LTGFGQTIHEHTHKQNCNAFILISLNFGTVDKFNRVSMFARTSKTSAFNAALAFALAFALALMPVDAKVSELC
jgi:hypothetical protein